MCVSALGACVEASIQLDREILKHSSVVIVLVYISAPETPHKSTHVVLLILLHAAEAENPAFSAWHKNIVVGISANLNATVHHVKTTLIQICTGNNYCITLNCMPFVRFHTRDSADLSIENQGVSRCIGLQWW